MPHPRRAPSCGVRSMPCRLLWILLLLLNSLAAPPGAAPGRRTGASAIRIGRDPQWLSTVQGRRGGSSCDFTRQAAKRIISVPATPFTLVEQLTGESLARYDDWADHQHSFWLLGPDYQPIYRQSVTLNLPQQLPRNRALSLVLALWRRQGGEYRRQATLSSDLPSHSESQIVLHDVVIPAPPSHGRQPTHSPISTTASPSTSSHCPKPSAPAKP